MLQCRLLLRSLCPTLSAHANKRLLRNAFQSFRNASSTIFDSPFESIAIPNTTLWHIAEKQAHAIPDKVASQCAVTNEKVTFKQLFENAKSIACGLETDGIQRGDVVLLHSPNCLEYMMITLGRKQCWANLLTNMLNLQLWMLWASFAVLPHPY